MPTRLACSRCEVWAPWAGLGLAYHGEIPDMLAHYIDVDGDDLPKIITDETCDGRPISATTSS